jgi:hypothetical protein
MKKIIITIAVTVVAIACKKDKDQPGQKCVWNVIFNDKVAYEWLSKPTADQVKKIEDSCACTITVNEVCFSCNTTVTTSTGIDVQCK